MRKKHFLHVSLTVCALIKQLKYTGYIDLEPQEWNKIPSWMSVSSLLELIWHLLNKYNISLVSLCVMRPAGSLITSKKSAIFPTLCICKHVYCTVVLVEGKMIFMKKHMSLSRSCLSLRWTCSTSCSDVWVGGMCWCVSVCAGPLTLKSQWTGIFVIKSGVVTSAAMLTFQLGDCLGSP